MTDENCRDGTTHMAPEERGASQGQDADRNKPKSYSRQITHFGISESKKQRLSRLNGSLFRTPVAAGKKVV
jgi:hypothetical protein